MKKILLAILMIVVAVVATYVITLFFFPKTFVVGYQSLQYYLADYERQTVTVEGYEWHYLDTHPGADGKPVMLMVHGFGADKDNWTLLAQELRDVLPAYRLIAVDLPGFGENTRDEKLRFDIVSQTLRLKGFVDALDLPALHLVGNSMGGFIAATYTANYPDEVKTLALLANAGVDMPVKSQFALGIDQNKNALLVKDQADFQRLMAFLFVNPPTIPKPIQAYFAELAVASQDYNNNVFWQMVMGGGNLEPILPTIQQPTLIVWGDTDRVLDKSMVQVMRPLLPNERVVILKDTGHLPQVERPVEVAAELQEFLAEVTVAKPE